MKNKILLLIIVLGILSNVVSAFLISDQGTELREVATGNLTRLANLTIEIYDGSVGGNLIFNQSFSNAIANGSWNLMISPGLEYGKSYWKDYKINGEDLDFDGNERLELQSSVGKINNISFINLSLINSCASGSSIRLVYENGSVECETDDSGSGTVNLTNYALKNQSEIFIGNISTSQTGFFGWLGSLTSRITKLWVVDINATGNIETSENVSAKYFKGDGSLLTNLPAGVANNSWNQTLADTLYSGILWGYNQTPLAGNNISVSGRTVELNGTSLKLWLDTLYSTITWSYNQTTPANTFTTAQVGTANLHTHAAENITAGNFGAGNYNMSNNLTFNSNNQGIIMGNARMYWDGSKLVIQVT